MSSDGYSSRDREDGVFSPLGERLLGNDPEIVGIRAFAKRLARTDLTVFVTGETGTGKDIVANLIHGMDSRVKEPFVKVNCPSIPEEVLESELFGHDRGAFTGAHTSRPGRLELAQNGTVFLDEICETSLRFQGKLSQVLDGEPFMRVGGTRPIPMKARIIAASNRDLDAAVAEGRLREDIAFRLKEATVHLPPLRARQDDIPLLADHFNYHGCQMLGKEYRELELDILEHLKALDWPGNVRQLAARVNEFVVTGSRGALFIQDSGDAAMIPGTKVEDSGTDATGPPLVLPGKRFMPLKEAGRLAADKTERELIEQTLRYTLWNRRKAARLLSTSYSSLLRRIAKYKIGKQ